VFNEEDEAKHLFGTLIFTLNVILDNEDQRQRIAEGFLDAKRFIATYYSNEPRLARRSWPALENLPSIKSAPYKSKGRSSSLKRN
jgi:hypothetical protein